MSILRACSANLIAALSDGRPLAKSNLFTFTLANGTVYRWTSWDEDQTVDGNDFTSQNPWIKAGGWRLVNTMEVPTLTITLMALNSSFAGGGSVKQQIHNGLFDGASVLYERCYMPISDPTDTDTYGTIGIFGGIVAAVDITGTGAEIGCRGGNNRLNRNAPPNLYQTGCIHTFCDAGCTLSRATFTSTFAVGAAPTSTFIAWGAPPVAPEKYVTGTLTITTGAGAGQRRTIVDADASGLTLIYPLYQVPEVGDNFTAFKGCLKTKDMCNDDYANIQHFRAAPYIPPPSSAV